MCQYFAGNCIDILPKEIASGSVDFVLTSPPYDDLRSYNGYTFEAEKILASLFDVLKEGGVLVWVVGDKIKEGNRSLTSFRHGLAGQAAGFLCHDLMIYNKINTPFDRPKAYTQAHELMLVFSKGKPKTFNPLKDAKRAPRSGSTEMISCIDKDGNNIKRKYPANHTPTKKRTNVWRVACAGKGKRLHPAPFPMSLAMDHIKSWSNPGDLVLDPMCGSGTTCLAAEMLGRRAIGVDISPDYIKLAESRHEVDLLAA